MRLRRVWQWGGPTFISLACTPTLPNLSTPRCSILSDFLLGTPDWSCFPSNKREHNKAFASLGSGSTQSPLIKIDELKVSLNWQMSGQGGILGAQCGLGTTTAWSGQVLTLDQLGDAEFGELVPQRHVLQLAWVSEWDGYTGWVRSRPRCNNYQDPQT